MFLRMWKSDGETRFISFIDAVDWVLRNTPEMTGKDQRQVEIALRAGVTLETPQALIGSDRQAMERVRRRLLLRKKVAQCFA